MSEATGTHLTSDLISHHCPLAQEASARAQVSLSTHLRVFALCPCLPGTL